MSKEITIANSQAALEFFADVLMFKGLLTPEEETAILDAKSINDLDAILDKMALEVSGDG